MKKKKKIFLKLMNIAQQHFLRCQKRTTAHFQTLIR